MTAPDPASGTTGGLRSDEWQRLTHDEIDLLRQALRRWLPLSYEGGVKYIVNAAEQILTTRAHAEDAAPAGGVVFVGGDEAAARDAETEAVAAIIYALLVDHPMWEGIDYTMEREAQIAEFVHEAAAAVVCGPERAGGGMSAPKLITATRTLPAEGDA